MISTQLNPLSLDLGKPLIISRPFGNYVMENVLFKISFPAEFHAQTAVECAIKLHPTVKNKLKDIKKILITTQESAIRIISKEGPLHNPADRDHCLQSLSVSWAGCPLRPRPDVPTHRGGCGG